MLKDDPKGFHHQTFNFKTMQPYDGPKEMHWIEPDSSGAFGWMQYMAYVKFGDAKYLEAAKGAMEALNAETSSPLYDVILPFGAYAAARMNAEQGTSYDTGKFVNWCFDGGKIWAGGVSSARWGDYDIGGITTLGDGRPYLFETFHMASSLVPLTRYEPRLARAVGKWMLNAASNARLFYSGEIPDEYQIVPELKEISRNVIAYELLLGRSGKMFVPRRRRNCWTSTRASRLWLHATSGRAGRRRRGRNMCFRRFRTSACTVRRLLASLGRLSRGPRTSRFCGWIA